MVLAKAYETNGLSLLVPKCHATTPNHFWKKVLHEHASPPDGFALNVSFSPTKSYAPFNDRLS